MSVSTVSTKRLTRTVGGALLVASLAFTAGCSQIQEFATNLTGGDSDKALSMLSKPAGDPLWTIDVQPAGAGPLIIDDTVVSYVVEDGYLKLAGFDLETGEKKWGFDAKTGASTFLPVEAFVGEDGTPYVIKRNNPERTTPESGFSHPITIIKADTGQERKTTALEWWTAPQTPECLVSTMVCMMGMQDGTEVQPLGLNERGEFTAHPSVSVLPQFQTILDNRQDDDFVIGVGVDGINIGAFIQNGKAVWDIPLTDLGFPEILSQQKGNTDFLGASALAQTFADEGVVLIDATYRDLSNEVVVQQATVTALDMKSGEVLWATAGELCLQGVVCEGENSYSLNENGKQEFQAGNFTLVGFDLRTGDREWESTFEGMTMYPKSSWQMVGDSYSVLSLEGGNKLLNLESGEVTDLTEEDRFGCVTDGLTFTHYRSSRPDLPLVEDTSNLVTQSCGLSGENGDNASFTQNVVASRSTKPFTAGDEWSVFDKQVRVISTQNSIHAYEF